MKKLRLILFFIPIFGFLWGIGELIRFIIKGYWDENNPIIWIEKNWYRTLIIGCWHGITISFFVNLLLIKSC